MAETFYSFVEGNGQNEANTAKPTTPARIAVYDDMSMVPRVVTVEPSDIRTYLDEITQTVYTLASQQCDEWSFMLIRELVENFIHAAFIEPSISILDKGKTIVFSDQGPGIMNKAASLKPGWSSATSGMKRYIRGVGSGLPIVEEQMRIKNGTISIEDNIGHGTIVTVSLAHKDENTSSDTASDTTVQGSASVLPQAFHMQYPVGSSPMPDMPLRGVMVAGGQMTGQPYLQGYPHGGAGGWPASGAFGYPQAAPGQAPVTGQPNQPGQFGQFGQQGVPPYGQPYGNPYGNPYGTYPYGQAYGGAPQAGAPQPGSYGAAYAGVNPYGWPQQGQPMGYAQQSGTGSLAPEGFGGGMVPNGGGMAHPAGRFAPTAGAGSMSAAAPQVQGGFSTNMNNAGGYPATSYDTPHTAENSGGSGMANNAPARMTPQMIAQMTSQAAVPPAAGVVRPSGHPAGADAHTPLSPEQKEALSLFAVVAKVGPSDLQRHFGVPAATGSRRLREMAEAGYIVKKGQKYILTGEGERMLSFMDDIRR